MCIDLFNYHNDSIRQFLSLFFSVQDTKIQSKLSYFPHSQCWKILKLGSKPKQFGKKSFISLLKPVYMYFSFFFLILVLVILDSFNEGYRSTIIQCVKKWRLLFINITLTVKHNLSCRNIFFTSVIKLTVNLGSHFITTIALQGRLCCNFLTVSSSHWFWSKQWRTMFKKELLEAGTSGLRIE